MLIREQVTKKPRHNDELVKQVLQEQQEQTVQADQSAEGSPGQDVAQTV